MNGDQEVISLLMDVIEDLTPDIPSNKLEKILKKIDEAVAIMEREEEHENKL